MKKSLYLFAAALCAVVGTHAQTPFPVGVNVGLAKPGMNNASKVYTLYTSTSAASATFTTGVTFNPTYDINGIGLNPVDNLVYGAAYTGNTNTMSSAFDVSLQRVGADGTVVNLGLLPLSGGAGSGSTEFVNFSAGTVSINGAYYYMTYALKPGVMLRILFRTQVQGLPPDLTANDLRMFLCWKNNISSLPVNPGGSIAGGVSGSYELNFSNADVTAAINAFLVQVNSSYPDVFNADGGIQDFAINPVDTRVYGYISYPSGASTVGRPVVMNPPVAGVSAVTPVGTIVNAVPGQEVAGVQFDMAGNFYGLFTTGDYAQINLTSGALTGMTLSNIGTTSGNLRGDLASAITNIPFPIKLVRFDGRNNGTTNELTWMTASEQNNKDFIIERSEDLKEWTAIGTVQSKAPGGNSQGNLYYSFTDPAPHTGMEYYRLKQSDLDGKVTYSAYIAVQSKAADVIRIYPNPATDYVYISGINKGNTIRLLDITGRQVIIQQANQSSVILNMQQMPSNTYILEVIADNRMIRSEQVIKK